MSGADGVRCQQKKFSLQCTKKLCSRCCARTFGECRVSGHNKARFDLLLGPLIKKLEIAANRQLTPSEKELWIRYKAVEADHARVHRVRDVRWDDDEKKYFHARVFSTSVGAETDAPFKCGRLYDVSFTAI